MMKYSKKIGYILLLSCLCSVACGQEKEMDTEIEKEVVTEKEPPKVLSFSVTPMPRDNEETVEHVVINESKGFPINMDIEISIDDCNAMNRKLTRDMDSGSSLFCIDENGIVYFVNQNHDNYLYCMKDGNVQLVVDIPVKEIYPWEDVVYFMIASNVEEKQAGDIYKYIPTTKEIQLVYALGAIKDAQNHKMTVNKQGIHFNYSQIIAKEGDTTRVKVSSYTLPFGEKEPVKDIQKLGKAGWGDYYFSYEFDSKNSTEAVNVSLVSRTNGKSDILPLTIGDFQYCVVGDNIYSIELGSSAVSIVNLKSQKKTRYDFRSGLIDANSYLKEEIAKSFGTRMEELISFTITENGAIVWATDGEYLYRINTEDKYVFPIETKDVNRRIEKLYTDGRRVYGLYCSERTGATSLVRFCTEVIEQNEIYKESTVEVQYLVQGDVQNEEN